MHIKVRVSEVEEIDLPFRSLMFWNMIPFDAISSVVAAPQL